MQNLKIILFLKLLSISKNSFYFLDLKIKSTSFELNKDLENIENIMILKYFIILNFKQLSYK